ncbi:hypothetical protein SAMN02949497_1930 [Methylomagnum ishizawai]|uniref:Uncharacterized protein n=1 Tax=Methylomagnum ishizawai TaxID=1760988 RepID=A0A1Y6CVE7_9GAMM|nr:DUF6682 family protein [Methylomagnum ishizawai]SMF94609.1 hypothetical protein SAMN02949497_1930 [Methylomagnum ishizawai]
MTTAATIIDNDISPVLNDTAATFWSAAERLAALNLAVLAVVAMRPDQFATNQDVALVAGYLQNIPADGLAFVDVLGVQRRDLEMANRMNPDWRTAAAGATRAVLFDPRNPRQFMVFPPAMAGATVPLVYVKTPAALASTADTVPVPEPFRPALAAYALGVLFSKDIAGAKGPGYFQLFQALMGGKVPVDAAMAQPVPTAEA